MRSALSLVLVGAFAANTALAQEGDQNSSPELQRAQRDLQQNKSEVERLVEMRLRHDLGLSSDGDADEFRAQTPTNTEAMERARQELRDQDAANASLLQRYNKLKAQVDQLHAETEARASAEAKSREFVVVPPANARPTRMLPDDPRAPWQSVAVPIVAFEVF